MSTITQFPSGNTQYRIEFDYLARTFVVVTLVNSSNPTLNRVLEVGRDYRFLNPTMIEILVDQSGFDIVRIHRQTGTDLVVDFRNGSVLTASDLTNAELQAIHIAEEGRDQTVDLAKEYADAAGSSAGNAKDSEDEARQIAESIKASGKIGYITRRSFEKGFNVTLWNEVLLWEEDGEYYRWDGTLPKNVPAGSTPESAGGIGIGAWVSVGDASLRTQLSSHGSGNGDNIVSHKQPFTGSINSTVGDKLSSILSPFDFGAVGDGVADDTAAVYAYCNAVKAAGRRTYDFNGGIYRIVPTAEHYAVTAEATTGPRSKLIDVSGQSGVVIKNGTFNVEINMALGEWSFAYAYDTSHLIFDNIHGVGTATSRYTADTVLVPVNTWIHSRADTKDVYDINVLNSSFNFTHTSGEGQQGYNVTYGKLLPVFFDAQIYSSRGALHFGHGLFINNVKLNDNIEYGLMIWGFNNVVIESIEIKNYGGKASLPPIRYFSFGAQGLRIDGATIEANPNKPNSYTNIQVIYGTDDTVNTDSGRTTPRGVYLRDINLKMGPAQSGIRLGNVGSVVIDGITIRENSTFTADNSSGLAAILVQSDTYTSNTAMNVIDNISITNLDCDVKRRVINIADVSNTIVKNVNIQGSVAKNCTIFGLITAEKAFVSSNNVKGLGAQGVGLACRVPALASSPWHVYRDNVIDGFADSITVHAASRDWLYLAGNTLRNITNPLSADARYSAMRTTTSELITSLVPRYVGEIVRTLDTNKVYISYYDTPAWILLN